MTLKEMRQANRYTRKFVAKALGVTSRMIYSYESGERFVPAKRLRPLAALYGVSLEEAYEAAYKRQNDAKEG